MYRKLLIASKTVLIKSVQSMIVPFPVSLLDCLNRSEKKSYAWYHIQAINHHCFERLLGKVENSFYMKSGKNVKGGSGIYNKFFFDIMRINVYFTYIF